MTNIIESGYVKMSGKRYHERSVRPEKSPLIPMEERTLHPELGERLREIYRLTRRPTKLGEFFELWRQRLQTQQEAHKFLELIRSGKSVIGETPLERGYSVLQGRTWRNVMCGLDALATAFLRGEGFILAYCPHCRIKMEIKVKIGKIVKQSPSTIIFWFGTGPKDAPGNPVCDHLHLFPSRKHLEAWLATKDGELGVALRLNEAFELGRIFDI